MAIKKRPILLIETPRAGIFGHRFLVSNIDRLGGLSPAAFMSRSALCREGNDYLSVSAPVSQELPGGSIRSGPETLLIAGIRKKRLKENEYTATQKWLTAHLQLVDEIIASLPDNRTAGSSTILAAPLLSSWEEELAELVPPRALKKKNPLPAILAGFALGVAVAAAIALFLDP